MKMKKIAVIVLLAGFGFMTITHAADIRSFSSSRIGNISSPSPEGAPVTSSTIVMPLTGLTWGMTSIQLFETVDKILDEDYKPLYQKVSPGVKMKQLDAKLAEEKSQFRNSRIDFSTPPTSADSTPLRGEYAYNNNETLLTLTRNGVATHFFLIKDRLSKVIEEHTLGEGSPQGMNYQDSVVRLGALLGANGRSIAAGVNGAPEADWIDNKTHLRLIRRSDTEAGFAYADLSLLLTDKINRFKKP
jgi:hypothetical protein